MFYLRPGFENSAATEDDGSNVRNNIVISVQPQTAIEGGRAELPVSTTGWRSAQQTQGQFIPMNGLDFLIGVNSLLIQQTVELDDMTSRIESENRYIVKVPQGEALYIASEVSSQTQRCLCGTGRGFVMRLHDNTRQEALVLTRRLAAASCCFPCRLQEMKVATPPGDYMGRIQQQWTLMVPFYLVRDQMDNVLFLIEGPTTIRRSSPFHCEFKIFTGDSLREVGKISHSWNTDLVSYTTNISFPPGAVQPKQKALLLAAGFLLSLEYYSGRFIRDTMHGMGNYHWRHLGPENISASYEGNFFCNRMHGYGLMSYHDGRTFQGLFCNNIRWGPGVECNAEARQDVGMWRGTQLVRLTWRPNPPSIAPDFQTNPIGRRIVDSHRTLLTSKVETVGEVNYALELLIQSGADPRIATDKWIKLYPKHCTDLASSLCQTDVFDQDYYNGKIYSLQEVKGILEPKLSDKIENDASQDVDTFYAWNNSNLLLNIMKHCYMHEKQRSIQGIDLQAILSGPRKEFKPAGDHELNCRSLLMASYLGYIADVAQFVNENNIYPDVTDIQGNSALMYAANGDQAEVIHFLVEAGADVDLCNDCCCTPLGVALMRYTCACKDISPSSMVQALLPEEITTSALEPTILEWNINRDLNVASPAATVTKSLLVRNGNTKKNKSQISIFQNSIRDQQILKRKMDPVKALDIGHDPNKSDEERLYNDINREYCIKITNVFTKTTLAPYIFDINNMTNEIDAFEEQKNSTDKKSNKNTSKIIKRAMKTSKHSTSQNIEVQSMNSEANKTDERSRIKETIVQLLSDGADPRLVKCPQPALVIAIMSNDSDLLQHLIECGADVNETYPGIHNYTPIDIAVSRPFNVDNLEVVHTLLASGADPRHRLFYTTKDPEIPDMVIPGPTLLHAVLARKVESFVEEDVCRHLLELLLEYDCDPAVQFKGSSPIDETMNNHFELLDVFVKSPKTRLNAKINDQNQSIFVKMFSKTFFKTMEAGKRLQTFNNILLSGADPLVKCQNGEDIYPNIFVFAWKNLNELQYMKLSMALDAKGNKFEKTKKEVKVGFDEIDYYKQAIEHVTDYTRNIHVRWLQAGLVKELIQVIDKYKHRQWNMILKELGDTKSHSLWLTPERCLEIWNLLSSTKKKIYNNQRVLRYLLSIIILISWNNFNSFDSNQKLTAVLKGAIEKDVVRFIRQHSESKELPGRKIWNLSYVQPELTKDILKFNVCFECALPLGPDKIICCWCNLISFCSYKCIKINISRADCHPCSEFLNQKYSQILETVP